ncbi:MAG: AAA family ATPase [Elusimicrobia bacterium]|nr:AAA family ATPase [Elusimicrobiota bacterium]
MKLSVDPKALEAELAQARIMLAGAGLPNTLAVIDPGAFGTTSLNLQALDATASGLAASLAASKAPEAAGVPAAYWGFLFAEEAAERLRGLGDCREPPDQASLNPEQYRELSSARPEAVFALMLSDCAAFLRFYQRHPDSAKRVTRDAESLRCLHAHFRLMSRLLKRLQAEPQDLQVLTPRMRFSGYQASPSGGEEPDGLLPLTFDDIVGNEDFVKAARRLARDVAGFDIKAGVNPKKVRNQVLFVLGTPGCGKTATAHALGRYFLDLCKTAGLPSRMRIIRRTDWASAYQNQSANSLLEIFKAEVFNAPGVCGVYWPDIDTAFAARGDSDIRQEEKSILGTLFGILDGTVGPQNGRWFLICDANTLNMDEATLSRISQNPIRALGPASAADFIRLLRDVKLRGKGPWLPVSDEEWKSVGERCVLKRLSGRAVDHLAGRILTEMEDFEEPDEYFSMPLEEKRKLIAKLSRPVGAQRILDMIEEYCRFERDSQRKSEEDRFLNRVREIRFHLSAQRAALGGSEGA